MGDGTGAADSSTTTLHASLILIPSASSCAIDLIHTPTQLYRLTRRP